MHPEDYITLNNLLEERLKELLAAGVLAKNNLADPSNRKYDYIFSRLSRKKTDCEPPLSMVRGIKEIVEMVDNPDISAFYRQCLMLEDGSGYQPKCVCERYAMHNAKLEERAMITTPVSED